MDLAAVKAALHAAVKRLYADDYFLLQYDVHECAIAHRIAVYLESGIDGFQVDCEYNNDLDSETGRKAVCYPDGGAPAAVRPDIVVHHRGRNGCMDNLLVVELKKMGSPESEVCGDRQKLSAFTAVDGPHHFAYVLGALLTFGVRGEAGKCNAEWFVGGQPAGSTLWVA